MLTRAGRAEVLVLLKGLLLATVLRAHKIRAGCSPSWGAFSLL